MGGWLLALKSRMLSGHTLGAPVVPEVYMMVQMSSGWQATGSAGCLDPSCLKASKECTVTPWLLSACVSTTRQGDSSSLSAPRALTHAVSLDAMQHGAAQAVPGACAAACPHACNASCVTGTAAARAEHMLCLGGDACLLLSLVDSTPEDDCLDAPLRLGVGSHQLGKVDS